MFQKELLENLECWDAASVDADNADDSVTILSSLKF